MKKICTLIAIFLFGSSLMSAQNSENLPEWSMEDIHINYEKEEVYITMRDGIRLFTSVYSPKDQSRTYPILMIRTPYCSESDPEAFSDRLKNYAHLLREGYIFVFQDVRGRFMSEGEYEDIRPFIPNKKKKETDENSDTYDTVDWLVKNVANNNGKVGIFGISYPGFYSTMALPEAHPALKAVSPQAPVTNWFIGDDFHHNGAFFMLDAFSFFSVFGRARPELTRTWPKRMDFKSQDNYQFLLDLGPVKNVEENYFGDTIHFWPDLIAHPDYDEFWKARDPLPHLTNVRPAVLVVGGWFDAEDLYGSLKTYKAIEKQNPEADNKLFMGPWHHGAWTRTKGEHLGNIYWGSQTSKFYKKAELQFFNYHLKGKGKMDLPEASIFLTGENTWRAFDSWPPKNTVKRKLYLQADQKLSFSASLLLESFDEYASDPNKPVPYAAGVHMKRTKEYLTDDQRFASRRPDVMVYESEVLDEAITIAGPMQVEFYVSTTGTDADYVVKLIDVFPEEMETDPEWELTSPLGGYQMLVRGEIIRGRYRNSFEKPEAFVSGEVTKVSFEIPDLGHTFKKGHRLMIQVQNSWFPLADRNPQQFINIYECEEEDFIKATHRIYHDAKRPSHVSVMVLEEE